MRTLCESIFDIEDQDKSIDVSKNKHIVKKFYNKYDTGGSFPKYKDLIGNDLKIGDIVLFGENLRIGLAIIKEFFDDGEQLIINDLNEDIKTFCDCCIKCTDKILKEII